MPVTTGPLNEHYILEERGIDLRPGHYARVFAATSLNIGRLVAFKVLRPEHLQRPLNEEYLAFAREARLLYHFRNAKIAEVVEIFDCGFVEDSSHDRPVSGQIVSFGADVDAYAGQMETFYKRHWRPYLCEEVLPEGWNLFARLQEYNQIRLRRRLPTEEALALTLKYVEVLQKAHASSIVYLDAKLEHFYWNGADLRLIDWNASRHLELEGIAPADAEELRRIDIRAFVIGVLYSVLTGMPPDRNKLFEPMPSDLQQVKERYLDTESLDFDMEPSLGKSLVDLMQAAVDWHYKTIEQFANDLKKCAREYGWDVGDGYHPSSAAAQSRRQVRVGLEALRKAQSELEHARRAFMAARDSDGNAQEAKRLHDRTLEFWNHRVIP